MKVLKFVLLVAVLLLSPAIASAFTPGTGLATTPHDFTQANNAETTEDVGLCTFCHTPHRAVSTLLLWNHVLSSSTFDWDVDSTTGGTPFPTISGANYNGPTAKCLSCHDGTVAIGDVYWFDESGPHTGAGTLNPGQHAWPDPFNVGATDGNAGSMKGNHPVAMPYPLNQVGNTYNGSTTGLAVNTAEFVADPQPGIRLFNDDGSGNITAGSAPGTTGIECSSCHDPHNSVAVSGDFFLRGLPSGNTADYICVKCHIK